jgi:hypothetical protein
MLPLAARLRPIILELVITLLRLVMLVMGWATVTAWVSALALHVALW